jgi:DNA-binding GntR family transcriptional regulator
VVSTTVNSDTSRYIEVARRLRDAILTGRYRPGSRLPAERVLESAWGVSRVTIRRALRVLEEERLVRRRHGSGTYVSPKPTRRIPLMIDYTGTMRDHAPALRRRVLCWRLQPALSDVAEALGIAAGDTLLYAERLDELDGVGVACDRTYIVERFAGRLTERDLSRVDFIEAWTRREGFSIEACDQTIEAVAATAEVSRRLGVTRGRPVLKSTELYLTRHDRPAGVFVSLYHPARICIASRFQWAHAVAARRQGEGPKR